ncbi:MAG: type II methionyl aminopeptidase [Candidatus Lokiarchaeota archaeon]|nr:type II methionyl aminopeptidase [Candidatus Lokiarchaeota archaeon]
MAPKPHPDSLEAGRIAARVLDETVTLVTPGRSVIDICEFAEQKIRETGAYPAFPCNVSINSEAAHYSSPYGDTRKIPEKGLIKIDLGAHVNGHISDTASTIDLDGSFGHYIAAVEDALQAAIEVVSPGIKTGQVGAAIEEAIRNHDLQPVYQLSGHELKPWTLHAGRNVPNVGSKMGSTMRAGDTFAIEPFATDGDGSITSDRRMYIFRNNLSCGTHLEGETKRLRDKARRLFGSLPWASRWIYDTNLDMTHQLKTLLRKRVILGYPVLLDGKDGMVSQKEHTVFVAEDGAIVTTML